MPFVKGDKNINRGGRPSSSDLVNPKSLNKVEVREKEFKQILRRLKPINNKVIAKFEEMFMADTTTEANRIKLGVFLLKTYTDLIDDVYKDATTPISTPRKDDGEDDEEQEDETPTISLRVLESSTATVQ